MKNPIYINDAAMVAAVDSFKDQQETSFFNKKDSAWVGPISSGKETQLNAFLKENESYKSLDRSVQLALLSARSLKNVPSQTGINIGSSRGATGLWEEFYSRFRESGTVPTATSPLTTLGNISSWVAQDLGLKGTAFSHSITCATASHAILNAIAWLESGMATSFIAGGSEAPLTPFTVSQMQALRIYSRDTDQYPCKALDLDKTQNSMILGEAAAVFLLSKEDNNSVATITGYGSAIEKLASATSVTASGDCLQESMRQATQHMNLEDVDAIITHAPGTIKGDRAEFTAIKSIFGDQYPRLCNNKWQLGHALGASSALNLAMGIEMLQSQSMFTVPFLEDSFVNPRGDVRIPKRILINATGFGGNAVSLLIEK
ncbi:3-oxoacyl-(acyl-carrier-protein) synthase [Nonlabens xylanidelens]|uniref:3-oxoacyl-(Acyl-carrier-protein) synthase n=1 Tax=Nonlabens xylanidelens TaxID=191564 RepID=A0A2S6IQN1_9FLAO|nr:beta-ketoacyl synthase N-terminal-like domain-containing protein [Nonlabens xylanidelens]PPK96465.1 3-oxoacyl-(acyl-carrier-protein) synthase [Nonlabens xylanidelens]